MDLWIFQVLKSNPSHLKAVAVFKLLPGGGGDTLHHLLLNGDLVLDRRAVGANLHPGGGQRQVGDSNMVLLLLMMRAYPNLWPCSFNAH